MAKQILILDDDKEFNNLLTDVFEQADYEVVAVLESEGAIKEMQNKHFDLVVTDQRLPTISGLDFIKKIRGESIRVPIIMVSGYLDNETIRELIRSGVNGIFIKPLNIFSLLKKAAELIEISALEKNRRGKDAGSGETDTSIQLSFLPCHSQRAREFASMAQELSGFSRNLLLIGPEGMPYEAICGDIVRLGDELDELICFKAGSLLAEKLIEKIEKAKKSKPEIKRITIGLLDGDVLTTEEIKVVTSCVSGVDEFGEIGIPVRLIVCLKKSVEELYDEDLIDQDFYMFLGSNELRIPKLSEMSEDIIPLVERELKSISNAWTLDNKARAILQRHEWSHNILELREVVLKAVALAKQNKPRGHHFEAALSGVSEDETDDLHDSLLAEKNAFLVARRILSGA